jgi:uncharacterized membrane protein YraQ (UPF0718 family)
MTDRQQVLLIIVGAIFIYIFLEEIARLLIYAFIVGSIIVSISIFTEDK